MAHPPAQQRTVPGADAGAERARLVEAVLGRIDALPTLSPVAARLLSLTTSRDADVNEIIALIESDPPQAARILAMCRSADKGLGPRITSVKRAVLMLGIDAVRAAVLSLQVYDVLNREPDAADEVLAGPEPDGVEDEPGFDRTGFWKHAVGVACAAELIAKTNPRLRIAPEEAFLAGLLHDLGRQAMELVLPRAYGRVLRLARKRRSDAAPLERAVIGVDHHTAGKRLGERWLLPGPLVDVMWLHSRPEQAVPDLPHRSLIGLVTLSKDLCRRLHLGWSGDYSAAPALSRWAGPLGLEEGSIEALAGPLHEAARGRMEVLGLDKGTTPELLLSAIGRANAELSRLNADLSGLASTARTSMSVLGAVTEFLRESDPERAVEATSEAVCRSAARVLDAGFVATIVAGEPASQPWRVTVFDAQTGRAERGADLAPPADRGALQAWRSGRGGLSVLGMGPKVAALLSGRTDPRRVRLESLTPQSSGGEEDGVSAFALLLYAPRAGGASPSEAPAAASAAWWSVLSASLSAERARRLHERLADVSRELAESQAKLTEAQSLARLGEMTAGAAHEMNNPLTVISLKAQSLLSWPHGPEQAPALKGIVCAADELSEFITVLHVLSQPLSPHPERCELGRVVSRALELSAARLGRSAGAAVRLDPHAERPETPLVTDPELLAIGLAELIINAAEADPDREPVVTGAVDELDGRFVLTVTDRGPGFSARGLEHAFDAFFSEKRAGRQKGLGLTRARRMVESIGGEIGLRNEPEGGASVMIWIPASQGSG